MHLWETGKPETSKPDRSQARFLVAGFTIYNAGNVIKTF